MQRIIGCKERGAERGGDNLTLAAINIHYLCNVLSSHEIIIPNLLLTRNPFGGRGPPRWERHFQVGEAPPGILLIFRSMG